MVKKFSILTTLMTTLAIACAYILLGLALAAFTGYAAEPEDTAPPWHISVKETAPLNLPIRENPVAAGANDDYYVIRANGTLIESTYGYDSRPTGSGFSFNRITEVMDNTAAVYSYGSGILIVNRDGSLWSRGVPYYFEGLVSEEEKGTYEPHKLLEDVSMVSADQFHAIILKRDGTLWVAGYDEYGAPWLNQEHPGSRRGDPYFVKVMDHVIWAEASYYGAYVVTADQELWAWGTAKDSTDIEKLADGVTLVSSADMAVTEQGDLLNWVCTGTRDGADWTFSKTEPKVILDDVAKLGRGFVIKTDGSLWSAGAGWGSALRYWTDKYFDDRTPYELTWGAFKDGGDSLQKIPVEDAAYAAIGPYGMIVLDEHGRLWGVYDLNFFRDDPFQPIAFRLGDGYFGAEEPASDGMANFTSVRKYKQGMFSDVQDGAWYVDNVKAAYELGLMNGYTNGTFQPNGTITRAEAIAIAARVRALYWGDPTELSSTGLWYQPYINYGLATQIQKFDIYDYDVPATRAELACLLSGTLPMGEFPTINEGISFSDVTTVNTSRLSKCVMWMAEAGIMQGKGNGRFDPNAPVLRGEAAAMLSRCVQPELRLQLN